MKNFERLSCELMMPQAQATPLLMTCLHVNFLQVLQTLTDVFCYSARFVLFLVCYSAAADLATP